MRKQWNTRMVYVATTAALLALTGGFVMAASIGTFSSSPPAQGGAYSSSGALPAGVVNTGSGLTQASATASATTNSLASPHVLTATTSAAADTVAINAVSAVGDYVETVTITLTAGTGVTASQEYAISIYINTGSGTPQNVYVETSSTFAAPGVDTVQLEYDLGSGSGSFTVSSVSDLVTQCSAVGSC